MMFETGKSWSETTLWDVGKRVVAVAQKPLPDPGKGLSRDHKVCSHFWKQNGRDGLHS